MFPHNTEKQVRNRKTNTKKTSTDTFKIVNSRPWFWFAFFFFLAWPAMIVIIWTATFIILLACKGL